MTKMTKADKQEIIDEYLQDTGSNYYVPAHFIDWLQNKPEHRAYEWFFSMGDEEAAKEYRTKLARSWASGLRFTIKIDAENITPK